jgi:23S rRNA pseudouridine1911/1915/1917 synthase
VADFRELVVEKGGSRLDAFLAGEIPDLSRSRVAKLIEGGNVLVAGELRPSRYLVKTGERITVTLPEPEPATPRPQEMPLEVKFEDEHLLVINKPAGLVVHPGAGAPDGTLVNALLARPGSVSSIGGVERPGIVHRLDKDTSGLLLVAKTDRTHLALSRALAARDVKRLYWAIALRVFNAAAGKIDAPIGRHVTQRTKMAVHGGVGSRHAVTHWKVLEQFRGFTLLECRLETGRTHQIRVHLAHEKHPILGDETYGGSLPVALQLTDTRAVQLRNELKLVSRQMLHARQLQFVHPITGADMFFEAPEPADFAAVLGALRNYAKQ